MLYNNNYGSDGDGNDRDGENDCEDDDVMMMMTTTAMMMRMIIIFDIYSFFVLTSA